MLAWLLNLNFAGSELQAPTTRGPQQSGPGISPDSRLQFSSFAYDTTYTGIAPASGSAFIAEGQDQVIGVATLVVSGTAAIVEGLDKVVGAGSLSVSGAAAIVEGLDKVVVAAFAAGLVGSAAILEGPDAISASGIITDTGAGVIVETQDGIAAFGLTGATAVAAIGEGLDRVVAAGSLASAGSAAIIEFSDSVIGRGTTTAGVGAAAILEQPDVVASTATIFATGAAAIVESQDQVVGAATTALTATAAIYEGNDYITLVGVATAQIIELGDAVVGLGVAAPQRFGWANIVAMTQAANGIQAAMSTYVENSACIISASYFSMTGQTFTPTAIQYRVDDVLTGSNMVPWTSVSPAPTNQVIITSAQNAIVSYSLSSEQHQVLFQITDGFGDINYARVLYTLMEVPGIPSPDLARGSAAIVESIDLVTGGD